MQSTCLLCTAHSLPECSTAYSVPWKSTLPAEEEELQSGAPKNVVGSPGGRAVGVCCGYLPNHSSVPSSPVQSSPRAIPTCHMLCTG